MVRWLPLLLIPVLISCSVSKNYNPNKKYPQKALQEDYALLRDILTEKHPSLYWYSPKDSMDLYFAQAFEAISDSMTELQFGWQILAPLTTKIHCGHTSFSMSRNWNRFIRNRRIPSFPLHLKVWNDTMMVVANLNKNDSLIKNGYFIKAINGIKNTDLIRTMFSYMPADGYSENVNYIRLSASFPYFHRNIFGLYQQYFINYSDSSGVDKIAMIPYYAPSKDSIKQKKEGRKIAKRLPVKDRLALIRNLEYDSGVAYMTLRSFSKGRLRAFFRRSFRDMRKNQTENLVIDLRGNGGGDIANSAALSRYVSNKPFRIADTAFSRNKNFRPFTRYISNAFLNNLGLLFVSHKRTDGKFHFGFWERHVYKPVRKNHFSGNVFVLTNGLTFSASTLFCNSVKGQPNIRIAGEETGGGWYGNSGILIPEITLPNTKLRVRLPFFRLVQYNHVAVKGTGVIPDIFIGTNWRDVLTNTDTKIERIKELIAENAVKE